jgi:hypothetical protein
MAKWVPKHRYFELTIKVNHKKKHNFNNNKYISIIGLMKWSKNRSEVVYKYKGVGNKLSSLDEYKCIKQSVSRYAVTGKGKEIDNLV